MNLTNKKHKASLLILTLIVFVSGTFFLLFGEQQRLEGAADPGTQPNFWTLAFKTLIVLGFVIVLVYAVLYLLKRFVYRKNFGKPNNLIEMLDFVPLVAKKSICVVKVVDRILVLGISENTINKLSEINDEDEQKNWLALFDKKSGKRPGSFAEQLQSFLGHSKN